MSQNNLLIGRVLVVLSGAIWLGGLTFYASVVIPMAHGVLGNHTTVGFITQHRAAELPDSSRQSDPAAPAAAAEGGEG